MTRRYQDYVIRDGQYIGEFDEMYQRSAEVPWHQDQTVRAIFSDLTVAILKYRRVTSLLDVGCGLGYMTERLRTEVPGLDRVVGMDISPTAVSRAQEMFPQIEFVEGTPATASLDERFDVVVSKDVLWYTLSDLPGYLAQLRAHSSRWIYIGQSFPEARPYYGEHLLPDADGLFRFLAGQNCRIVYSVVERDAHYGGREYAHALIEMTE